MEYKRIAEAQSEEIKQLKEELHYLKKKMSAETPIKDDIKFLISQDIKDLEIIEEINDNDNRKILKVAKKQFYVLSVIKAHNPPFTDAKHLLDEYEIMRNLHHPNVLQAYGIFLGDESNLPSILLEFCPLNIEQAIMNKELSNVKIVCAIYQIAEGMKYIHSLNIILCNIKPANILIASDGTIKISDFSICKLMTCEEQSMACEEESMSPDIVLKKFLAPEIIIEEKYNEKTDVYSFGILIFFMLNDGKMPQITINNIMYRINPYIPSSFTQFAKELINSCWSYDPDDRPSFNEIAQKLEKSASSLLDLSKSEIKQVDEFIKMHKENILYY